MYEIKVREVMQIKQVDKEEKPTKLAFSIPKHILGANLNI
jgi:hypothetical protein